MKKTSLFSFPCVAVVAVLSMSARVDAAELARPADQFVDGVGMNIHMGYTDSVYASNWPGVLAALEHLHVRHVRDGFYDWTPGTEYYAKHQQLKAAGIDTDYVVRYTPTLAQVQQVQQLATDMGTLEGPDELDDQKGADWASVLNSFMPTMYGEAQNVGVPVVGPSLTYRQSYVTVGNIGASMNYNSLHMYFGGRNPGSGGWGSFDPEHHSYGSIPWWLDQGDVDAPGVPSYVTETGYICKPVQTPYTLPQDIESRYVQRTMMEMFNAGIKREYFYELADDAQQPGYGFFTLALKPKMAATAMGNLLEFLADPGTNFTPGSLDYTLSGAAANVHHVLLQKQNGSFYLVLWIEASGYNQATNVVTPVASQNVTLTLNGAGVRKVYLVSDAGKITATGFQGQTTFPMSVTDQLTILQIR